MLRSRPSRRVPLVAAALLAGAGLFSSNSVVALQDVAALAEIEVAETARWRAHFVAAPPVLVAHAALESFDLGLHGRAFGPSEEAADDRGFALVRSPALLPPAHIVASERPARAGARVGSAFGALGTPVAPGIHPAALIASYAGIGEHDGATPGRLRLVALTPDAVTPSAATAAVTVQEGTLTAELRGSVEHRPAASTEAVADAPAEVATATPAVATLRTVSSPEEMARELKCMAEAIYFEARGEPESGQYAVAQVVMNRVRSGYYPDTVCGVVYQNKHLRNRCQFSFACDGIPDRVNDKPAWALASKISVEVVKKDHFMPEIGAATHYHADYVKPRWIWDMDKLDVIGRHIFYRDLRWGSEEG